MRILVYDVAAESGGALTILQNVYRAAKEEYAQYEWVFVLSLPALEQTDRITVLNYPEVKKSWAARLRFDRKHAPAIVKRYQPDVVLNLQNITIRCDCEQILYMHQSLPFARYRFSLREDRRMWLYQNVIGRLIVRSCKRADRIIVQTQWIKRAVIRRCKVREDKIEVRTPAIDVAAIVPYRGCEGRSFFYPARGGRYKNHRVILDACELLERRGVPYEVVFTLDGSESDYIASLKRESEQKGLSIVWAGIMDPSCVYEYYADHIMLFPSRIESAALPLKEASACGCPILASDTEFSREMLEGYPRAEFFDDCDFERLADLMQNVDPTEGRNE